VNSVFNVFSVSMNLNYMQTFFGMNSQHNCIYELSSKAECIVD
jgi:hypothetical protein